jgi:hypothetical protein
MVEPPVILDAESAAFILGGVSINAASARQGALPNLARAVGCRVTPDRRSVRVFFAATPGAALLDDVRGNGMIAVVFTQPSTHRTLQLKSGNARIVPLEAGDGNIVQGYVDRFVADLLPLGYPERNVRTLVACDPDDLVAVDFNPSSAFVQTPGPNAGQALSGPP